ncbi:MAG: NAD(P)-dependent alcohol dehydrogenase [Acidobacteriota bacterium]
MKAYQVQEFGIDKLAWAEQALPEPGSREVVVKFHAASVNYRDLMVISGAYNPRMKLPAIPFSDGAGEITGVGGEVTKWKIGDRVMPIFVQGWIDGGPSEEKRRTALGAGPQWQGVLREFGAFSEHGLTRIPEHLSYEEASTLPCAAITAWQALVVSGGLKAGDTVLTLGTGGVSVFALQIAKMFGAQVISTSSSDEKLERMRTLGADEIINYKSREDWDAAVLELTGKRGVDHVVEVGGGGTLSRSINSVRVGGHVALIGALEAAGNFSYVPIFMKQIRLHGIFTGSRAMFEDMNRAITAANLQPVVDHVFPFDEVQAALTHMQSGSHFGKIVVRIGE